MEINRLLSDELTYELHVRGASVEGTVEEKRARLRSRIQFEKLGGFNQSFISDIDSTSELETCKNKIGELTEALNNFKGDKAKSERSRILSRLIHVEGRLNRITDESVREIRETLLEECDALFNRLDSVIRETVNPNLDTGNFRFDELQPGTSRPTVEQNRYASIAGRSDQANNLPPETYPDHSSETGDLLAARNAALENHAPTEDNSRIFSTVSKWGIFYDGTSSVTNFITRVEELRSACGITKPQLLKAAVVLFRDSALSWFRAFGDSSITWDDLMTRLRNTFLPSGYDEELWRDIRSRTQHNVEKSVIYIAVMENYFSLLRHKPEESRRVEVIRGNLLPSIQEKIGIIEARQGAITTLAELMRVCQHFDDVHSRTQRYRPPPVNPNQVVEPGLMFREPRRDLHRSRVHAVEVPASSSFSSCEPDRSRLAFVESQSNVLMSPPPSASETPVSAMTPSLNRNVATAPRRTVTCFNCRQSGHILENCPSPRVRRCYRCGQLDHTVRTCPTCSGNGRLESGSVEPWTR